MLTNPRKHLRDKHGLVRGDQGRLEGGKRKAPKYLTLCPTNWPFKHNSSSSCQACGDIGGVITVLDQRDHEGPSICSFCWTYLPTRRDLVAHVDQGPCRSNEGFPNKVAYVRHLYAETLCIPGAEEISRAAAGQRQAHAEAERAARSEK
jgi:Wiskott-Aldrich syndrome protein